MVLMGTSSEFLPLPEDTYGFLVFSILTLSLLFSLEAVHSTLSCLAGINSLYIHVYLSLLIGEGKFSILHHHHLAPPICLY